MLDWNHSQEDVSLKLGVVKRGLRRQSSQTGALVDLNETKVALFRHGKDVFAINEKCPHAGEIYLMLFVGLMQPQYSLTI